MLNLPFRLPRPSCPRRKVHTRTRPRLGHLADTHPPTPAASQVFPRVPALPSADLTHSFSTQSRRSTKTPKPTSGCSQPPARSTEPDSGAQADTPPVSLLAPAMNPRGGLSPWLLRAAPAIISAHPEASCLPTQGCFPDPVPPPSLLGEDALLRLHVCPRSLCLDSTGLQADSIASPPRPMSSDTPDLGQKSPPCPSVDQPPVPHRERRLLLCTPGSPRPSGSRPPAPQACAVFTDPVLTGTQAPVLSPHPTPTPPAIPAHGSQVSFTYRRASDFNLLAFLLCFPNVLM